MAAWRPVALGLAAFLCWGSGPAISGTAEPYGALTLPTQPSASASAAFVLAVYRAMLKTEADRVHLPVDLADAVMAIESGYNPNSIGTVGEIGLMQVRPSTAAMLGFKGSQTDLARPDVNIHYGVTYLAGAWSLTKGDLCRTLTKYRSGYGMEFMTPLSISYCQRAHDRLTSTHSQLASLPLNISPSRAGSELPLSSGNSSERPTSPVSIASTSQRFWAAEEARVRLITARLHARWRRMAAR